MPNPSPTTYEVPPGDRVFGGALVPTRNPSLAALSWPPGANCAIPDAEGVNAPQHPKVLDLGSSWNGYRFWMAYTPWPIPDNDEKENPCVVASNDGDTWVAPTGNPIFPKPIDWASNVRFNSDAHLSYVNGRLYLFWRYTDTSSGVFERLYVSETVDGVTWSEKAVVFESTSAYPTMLSPVLEFWNGEWWFWVFRRDVSPIRCTLRKAASLFSAWSTAIDCTLSLSGGREIWHFDVVRVPNGWAMLISDRIVGAHVFGKLWFAYSADGEVWTASGPLTENNPVAYRSSFVRSGAGYDCWVSDYDARKIRRARINDDQV